MPDLTPAAELRAAAATLRRLADAAARGFGVLGSPVADAAYIAAMNPTVGAALADALEAIVRAAEMDLMGRVGYRELLAVARAVNAKEGTRA